MSSVTGRIRDIQQPYGGYIKPSQFQITAIGNQEILPSQLENIPAGTVGMAVDYLTRFMMGTERHVAFMPSVCGANIAAKHDKGNHAMSEIWLAGVNGLDDISIINACKMTSFDVWLRNEPAALLSWEKRIQGQQNNQIPDELTCSHIRDMVLRSMAFWKYYGPIIKDGFTFEPNGYTKTVNTGDGDYLTIDTLWDFKVSKAGPTSAHTLQLLMYWIMGQHSGQTIYRNITRLGLFNPRMNLVYTLDIKNIAADIIATVEKDVICY